MLASMLLTNPPYENVHVSNIVIIRVHKVVKNVSNIHDVKSREMLASMLLTFRRVKEKPTEVGVTSGFFRPEMGGAER